MEMKIRAYVESLFRYTPKSQQAIALEEEMIQNLIEKYYDLLSEGKGEDAAYNITVASIGDVSELINSLNGSAPVSNITSQEKVNDANRSKKSALIIAIAVGLYICCVIPVILSTSNLAVCVMFLMIAVATGLLIYNGSANKKVSVDDSVAGEFKQWRQATDSRRATSKAICSAISAITIVAYFLISFATGAWYITWLIFIIGAAVEKVVKTIIYEIGGR